MDAYDRMFGEIAVRLELLTPEQLAACRKIQAEAGPGRNLGQLALALGLMSETEVELVSSHQRRVLARRREARDPSKREGAATLTHPERPARPSTRESGSQPSATNRSKPVDDAREPTMPRVPHEPRSLLGMGLLAPDMPLIYTGASAPVPTAHARSLTGAAHVASQAHKPALAGTSVRAPAIAGTPPRAAAGLTAAAPAASRHASENFMAGVLGPDAHSMSFGPAGSRADARETIDVRTLESAHAPQPSAAAAPTPASSERPGKRTEVPPSRAKRLASPPPSNTNNARVGVSRAVGGTLLGSSGKLEQAARLEAMRAEVPAPSATRTAADRGWRNPSKPPPPIAALRSDPSRLNTAAPTGTLAWNPGAAGSSRTPQKEPQVRPKFDKYLDQLLQIASEAGASDLHAHSGSPLLARVDGTLYALTGNAPLQPEAAETVIAEIMTDAQWDLLHSHGEVRFGYELPGLGRFRAHAYRQALGLDCVFRVLMPVASLAALDLPPALLANILQARAGLFLVSGAPGSGKSATLAALTHALANDHGWHVVTAEAPIETVHGPGMGMIEQREIPFHAPSFAECIEQAVRQGADAVVISDLSSASSVAAAVQAALSGCAVLAAVPADSPWRAIAYALGPFQGADRQILLGQLASVLRGVFAQRLVLRATGRGRVPALEIIPCDASIARLIGDDRLEALEELMSTQHSDGVQILETALQALVRARAISPDSARLAMRRKAALASEGSA